MRVFFFKSRSYFIIYLITLSNLGKLPRHTCGCILLRKSTACICDIRKFLKPSEMLGEGVLNLHLPEPLSFMTLWL